MDILRGVFYIGAGVIVSFIAVMNIVLKWKARRHRHLLDAKTYMTNRHHINESILDTWSQLEPYAQWLQERMDKPSRKPNSHAQPVSNDEIDNLIKDSVKFAEDVKKAIRHEHRMNKILTRNGLPKLPKSEHEMWHDIYVNTRHFIQYFQTKRLNADRRVVR